MTLRSKLGTRCLKSELGLTGQELTALYDDVCEGEREREGGIEREGERDSNKP